VHDHGLDGPSIDQLEEVLDGVSAIGHSLQVGTDAAEGKAGLKCFSGSPRQGTHGLE
jgi:hypothetical protein